MNNDFPPRQKRCRYCEHSKWRQSIKKLACLINQDKRALYWPQTGCPEFTRAPGADDTYNPDFTFKLNQN